MIRLGRLNKFVRVNVKAPVIQEDSEDKKEDVIEVTIPEIKKPIVRFVEIKKEELKAEKAEEAKVEEVKKEETKVEEPVEVNINEAE